MCRYLIADYERCNFSISECNWEGSLVQNIVAIPPLSRLEPKHPSRFSTAAIAGIAIGTIVCVGILLFILFVPIRKFSSLKIFSDRPSQEITELETSNKTLAELSSLSVMQELDGRENFGPELDESTSDMRWMDCTTGSRVTGSGRGRKRNTCLKALPLHA